MKDISEAAIKEFAAKLHDQECRHNHTDGCGWWYETKDDRWSGWAHASWLKKANSIIKEFKLKREVDLWEFLKHIKKTREIIDRYEKT